MRVRKLRKTLAALLTLLLLLTGCGSRESRVTVLREWEPRGAEESAADLTARNIRIGMVTDVGGINDASFNQSAWEGLQEIAQSTGATVDYLETTSDADYLKNFETLAEEGFQLVWGVGYNCADAIAQAARRHPETQFAIIDSAWEDTPRNLTGVLFRPQEPSFLVGYIAAGTSETHKVGFVGGVQGPAIDQFQYGYQAGAAYAKKQLGEETEVLVRYADSFSDPEKGRELAMELAQEGCDIIYHAAGGTGMGVIEAAEKNGFYAIGVDRDQAYLAPDHVLTSALKKVNVAVRQVSWDYIENREIGGKTFVFGLVEGAVGIPESHPNYSNRMYDAALRAGDDIAAGKLIPPSTAEEYEAFVRELEQ